MVLLDETIIFSKKIKWSLWKKNKEIFTDNVGLGLMRGLRVKDADTLALIIKTAFEFGVLV